MTIETATEETLNNLHEQSGIFIDLVYKKFKIKLDYSEESILLLDDVITLFFKLRKKHYYRAVVLIGSYLGDTIIANLGGKWAKDLSLKKVGKIKTATYPMIRARKRITFGMQESIENYYRSLKLKASFSGKFAEDRKKIIEFRRIIRKNGLDKELLDRILSENEKKYVREESAELLGKIGDASLRDELLKALNNPKTAYYIAIVMQGIGIPEAFTPLLSLLQKTRSDIVKMQTALALGHLRDKGAVPALVNLISNENEVLCHYGAMALGKIGGKKAVNMLLKIMGEQIPGKRVHAITALELIKDKDAVPALIEAIFSRDREVQEAAVGSFQFIPDPRGYKPLLYILKGNDIRLKILAAYSLAHMEGKAEDILPELKILLRDNSLIVRQHVAQLIHWLEDGKIPQIKCV